MNVFKPNKQQFIGKCHQCGRKGHKIRECYYYKRRQQYRAEQQNKNQNLHSVQTIQATTSDNVSGFAFMTGNYQFLRNEKLSFILDSGASDHVVNEEKVFSSIQVLDPPIRISIAKNGEFIMALKKGQIPVTTNMGVNGILEDVLYCPDASYNLLSVRKLQQKGMSIIFDERGVEIMRDGKTIMYGKPLNNLISMVFNITGKRVNLFNSYMSNKIVNSYELWHRRLGYIGKTKFSQLKNKQMVEDVMFLEKVIPNDNLCEACIKGEQTQLPFEKAKDKHHIM